MQKSSRRHGSFVEIFLTRSPTGSRFGSRRPWNSFTYRGNRSFHANQSFQPQQPQPQFNDFSNSSGNQAFGQNKKFGKLNKFR